MDNHARILIIDDEEGIRKGCSRVLQPLGYVTEVATTFHEGLQKIQSGQYDLILLDVMMPDGKGIDLLEPIRERDPEAVAVLITGYATVELAVDAIKRGAYDFISKPFTAQLLVMTVERGLEKRRLTRETQRLQSIERQVTELEEARRQAERLSEFKSSFATMVAHELRSPVGAAQTLVRTLLRGLAGELNEKQTEILGRVEIRLDGLLTLVNDLLTLAATKSLETERPLVPVQLRRVLDVVVQGCNDEIVTKHIALKYTAHDQDAQVLATNDGLAAIFSNLLGNAIKYTPPEGSIRVELALKDGHASVCVADSGIGIPAVDLPRIGEEFFRAQNARSSNIQGTGLGLSIVKEFVKQFAAEMEVKSEAGQGTSVTISFPLLKDPAAAEHTRPRVG